MNMEIEKDTKNECVKIGEHTYWNSYEMALMGAKRENGCKVVRWVRHPGLYVTHYC